MRPLLQRAIDLAVRAHRDSEDPPGEPYIVHPMRVMLAVSQADDAHLPKLDAALAHYAEGLPAAARAALARFWHAWNGVGEPDWADFQRHRTAFEQRAADWALELATLGDLAGNLAAFAKSQLK